VRGHKRKPEPELFGVNRIGSDNIVTCLPRMDPKSSQGILSFGLKEAGMTRQRHTAEQKIGKMQEAEVLQEKGMPIEEVLRQPGY